MARIIEVTVSPTGQVTIHTAGFAGSDCIQASKFLEQALGVATSDRKTAEFFQTTPAEQRVEQ
jgi:hypothetical protein